MAKIIQPQRRLEAITGLPLFLILALAASWTAWLIPFHSTGSVNLNLFNLRLTFPFVLLKLLLGNCFPGALALIWAWREGKPQVLGLLSVFVKWRSEVRWYALALFLPIVVFWASLGGTLLLESTSHALPSPSGFVRNFLLTLPFGPVWEEIAWRGYVLRKLQQRYTHLQSAIWLGIYWAVWHVPLWLTMVRLTPASASTVPIILVGMLTIFAWSFVFSSLFNRSGQCLPVVIVLHASYLAISSETYRVALSPKLFVGLSAVLSVLLAAIFAARMKADAVPFDGVGGDGRGNDSTISSNHS